MNKPQVTVGTFGDGVAELHERLRQAGLEVARSEADRRFFGPSTREAVRRHQQQHHLPPTGVVDDKTRAALAGSAVKEVGSGGAVMRAMATDAVAIAPRSSAEHIAEARVASGRAVATASAPDAAATAADVPKEFQFLIRGQVLYRNGLPIPGIVVRAWNKELRREDPLGDAHTDATGNFEIWYTEQQLARVDKRYADLIVRAYGPPAPPADPASAEVLLAESPVIYSAQSVEKVRLLVDGGVERTWSEYEQLVAEVEPALEGLSLTDVIEKEGTEDVSLLSGKTGHQPSRIAMLVAAHKLAARTDIAPEVFYGLARQNMSTNLSELLAQSSEVRQRALESAIASHTIPGRLTTEVGAIQQRFQQNVAEFVGGAAADSALGGVLKLAIGDDAQRGTFLTKFATHSGPAATFWKDLAETPGLKERVPDLQLTLQLATLTGNHVPLVDTLRRMREQGTFASFRDLARLGPADWKQIVARPDLPEADRVPADIPGATAEDREWTYAATLARVMEDVLPTEVLANRIRKDEGRGAEVRALFTQILERGSGFEMGRTPVREFLSRNPDVLTGVPNVQAAINGAEQVQRLFNVTPSYTEMKPLLDANLNTLSIAEMNQGTFVNTFKSALGAPRAAYIHERASYTAAATMNMAANYSPAFNQIEMRVLQRPAAAGVPDLERLFGSLDLCQCTHCRSVYGPAAYFAEVLAFLAERPQALRAADGSDVQGSAQDVLFARRPDLGDLELTCENTNTPLPYVDLVNEVLEQAIAPFGAFQIDSSLETALNARAVPPLRVAFETRGCSLSEEAIIVAAADGGGRWLVTDHSVLYAIEKDGVSGDIGVTAVGRQTGARAKELSANPEHVNAEAYERLRTAVFPWTLPLNLWWHEARVYLDHLKVPRHELMRELHTGRAFAAYTDVSVATEYVRLTPFERQLLTGGRKVRVATTGAIPSLSGLITVDGVTLSDGDLVVVKDQATPATNGLYAAAGGAWTREAMPADATALLSVEQGTVNAGTLWIAGGAAAAAALQPWEFWGLAQSGNQVRTFDPTLDEPFVLRALGWREALAHVREFLARSGLTYDELNELVGTSYVTGETALRIESADPEDLTTCDTSKLVINTLTSNVLMRARTLVRLWRALGWTLSDVDRAIAVLSAGTADINLRVDDALVVKLSHVQRLVASLGLDVGEVLTFWSNIDTRGSASPYARLFQNPAVIRPVDPSFALAGADLAIIGSPSGIGTLPTHAATILAALGLTASDLAALRASVVTDDLLNLANLSALYRYALLARGLNLSIADLLALRDLAAIDPFDPTHTEAAVLFVELVEEVRAAGFTVAELDYLLRHRTSEASDLGPGDDAVAQVLTEMRAGLLKIQDETRLQPDPEGELLRKKLALLRWHPDAIDDAIAHVVGTRTYTAPLIALPGGVTVPGDLAARVSHSAASGLLSVAGPLTAAERQLLWDLSPDAAYRAALTTVFSAPRQFATEHLKLFAWPTVSADLAALPAGIVFANELRGRIYYDAAAQKLRFTGRMTEAERALLLQASSTTAFQGAVQALFAAPAAYLPDAPNAFLSAADVSALFDLPGSRERVDRVLTRLLAYLRRALGTGLVTQSLAEALGLNVKAAEHVITSSVHAVSAPAEMAVADFLAPAFAESHPDVAITAAGFAAQFDAFRRLEKVAQVVRKLGFTPRQLEWLSAYDPAVPPRQAWWISNRVLETRWLDFDRLPVAPIADGSELFAALLRTMALRRARDQFRRGEAALSEILALAHSTGLAAPALRTALLEKIAERGGWSLDDLTYLAGPDALDLTVPDDFKDEYAVSRLVAAVRRLRRTGASAAQLVAWARPEVTAADARSIRQVVKAKYTEETWLDVAKPLRDQLRARQRRSLVDYLVPRADASAGQIWDDADGLYAHFLIDVQMEPCFMTSRLKQAISSAQLFIQRCLMNLEPGVVADDTKDPGWADWSRWMKNYRVWEANRKVFLYPENWIEPELRDDKTPFFQDLENELLQGDVTAESAEDALLGYLEKLDAVARLEVAGMFYQEAADGQPEVLHVFGRTQGTPPVYYYRQRSSTGRWSHWERVDLDISEEQIIPIIWNRRLFLFWPVFTEVMVQKNLQPEKPEPGERYFDIQMAWSERKHRRWTTKKVTKESVRSNKQPVEGTPDRGKNLHTFRAAVEGAGLKIWYEYDDPEQTRTVPVAAYYGGGTKVLHWANVLGFHFTGCDAQVQIFTQRITGVYQPSGTVVDAMMFRENASVPLRLPQSGSADGPALQATPGTFRLLYPHRDAAITGSRSFFYQDDQKTYFVSPHEVDVTYWVWAKSPEYVEPYHIDLLKRYYYERRASDPLGPVIGSERILPIDAAIRSAAVARRVTTGMGGTTPNVGTTLAGTGARVGAEVGAGATVAARVMGGAAALAGGVNAQARVRDYEPKWMLAKGERELIKVEEYISNERIFERSRLVPVSKRERRYTFESFYHPYVCSFVKELKRAGLAGFFDRDVQLQRATYFTNRYQPTALVERGDPAKQDKYPVEDVDFTLTGSYSQYNWELFCHIPMLIATRLCQNQRFEEAQKWFHFIFDPTDTSDNVVPQKYWRTRPFYEHSQADYLKQRIDRLLALLAKGEPDAELDQQVAEHRLKPFQPYSIARLRPVALQKAVVTKYLDCLVAWGDQLFRRDTIESINEATQLYVLAAEILGPRPVMMAPRAEPQVHTFNSLAPRLRQLTNEFVPIELLVPPPRPDVVVLPPDTPPLFVPKLLYFCVPPNEKLLGYWDTVADRLFKIRHCMNIEGIVRQLPLFEPPIDPALLVRAAAAGVDLSSALNDVNAPAPRYRFNVMARTTSELCGELKSIGASLLAALEKRDAEALSFTQARQESTLLAMVAEVRSQQEKEATQNVVALRTSRAGAVSKYLHFQKLLGVQSPRIPLEGETIQEQTASANVSISEDSGVKLIAHEKTELAQLKASNEDQGEASDNEHSASIANIFPALGINVCPWGIGLSTSFGGPNIGASYSAKASRSRASSAEHTYGSGRASKLAQLVLREHDWLVQSNTAAHEIMAIDQQIAAALIREEIAKVENRNHEKQREHAREVEEFLRDKFTTRELYSWMVGQISAMYFQAYQFTYDVAKRAERAFRFELGVQDSNFIQFGYWDSLRKGLLAGDRLFQDLKRMEVAYLDQHRREHEMTKHVSLSLLHPEALVELKESGTTFIELPEAIFDMDCPGHYMRRLKNVSVSIPCVTGPYTSVTCRLTLLSNRIRRDTRTSPTYKWTDFNDTRFVYNGGGIDSVVTSSAREDSGMFELNFNDERYLPFEGSGAISSWRIELPTDLRQFDYDTITDVVLHLRYTARDGGDVLRREAGNQLAAALREMSLDESAKGLYRGFSARFDFSNEWHRFLNPAGTGAHRLALMLDAERFPSFARQRPIRIDRLTAFIKPKDTIVYDDADPLTLTAKGPTGDPKVIELHMMETELGGLPAGKAEYGAGIAISPGTPWQLEVGDLPAVLRKTTEVNGETITRLNPDAIEDLGVVVHYTF